MQDVSQDTIANCWRHAGILPDAWVQSVHAQEGAAGHVCDCSSTEDDSRSSICIGTPVRALKHRKLKHMSHGRLVCRR
jgi:hypothetical protein